MSRESYKHRFSSFIFIAGVICAAFSVISGCRSEKHLADVQFFHAEICPSCETYKQAERITGALAYLALNKKIQFDVHNMVDPGTEQILIDQLEERGLPNVSRSVPILLVDDTYYTGFENIEKEVDELARK